MLLRENINYFPMFKNHGKLQLRKCLFVLLYDSTSIEECQMAIHTLLGGMMELYKNLSTRS